MAILDAYGNPWTPPKKPEERHIAAATIRDKFSSYPSQGLTPTRLATIFKEADRGDVYRQAELFEEMEEKDTHLGSVLQTRKLAVAGLDYEIIPASEDSQAVDYAGFIEEQIRRFDDWNDLILDILDAIGKGFSVNELYWSIEDGVAFINGYEWIHPKNLTFIDKEKTLKVPRLLTESEPVYGEDLIPHKFVFLRHKARSGHASRQGLIRVCAWMYLFKNYNLKDWVAFAEVYGMPLRIGKFDPNTSDADKETLLTAVTQLGSDAAGIISKNTDIEFIKTEARSTGEFYEKLANYCDKQMSKAVLGQTASTDETPGRLGAPTEKESVRQDLLEADAKVLQMVVRRDVFRPIIGFNKGWDQIALTPLLKLAYEPPEDLKAKADTYQVVVSQIGLPVGKQHLYQTFGIPEPQEGEEVVSRQQPSPGGLPFGMAAHKVDITDKSLTDKTHQATLDALADEAIKAAAGKFKDLMKPVLELVAKSKSLREVRLELAETYPDMDTSELEDLLARALYISDLAGRASVSATD